MTNTLPHALEFHSYNYDSEQRETISSMNYVNPFLKEIADKFQLDITEDLAGDFLNKGGQEMLSAILNIIETKLNEANISISSIINAAKEDASKEFKEILGRYSRRLSDVNTFNLSFKDGQYVFTPENERSLKERLIYN